MLRAIHTDAKNKRQLVRVLGAGAGLILRAVPVAQPEELRIRVLGFYGNVLHYKVHGLI